MDGQVTGSAAQDTAGAAVRLAFLAEASTVLASSLDYQTTLDHVAHLAVPRLADWCIVEVLGAGGAIEPVAIVHSDPRKLELARAWRNHYPPDPNANHGTPKVLRTGEPNFAAEISEDQLVAAARDPEHLQLLHELALRSVIQVPLTARGRTHGVLTLVAAESGRRYGPDDLALAQDLARRCALAVDNARLYHDAQEAVRRRDEALAEREAALQLHRSMDEQLTLLVEASANLSNSLALDDVLAAILALSRRMVPADAYAIWRYQPPDRWGIVSAVGLSETYQKATIAVLSETPSMPGAPVVVGDVENSPFLESRKRAYREEGVRSVLILPLRSRSEAAGTLVFYYRTLHPFTEVEVRVATALANLAASAIGTAELYEEQQRMRRESEAAQQRLAFLAEASAAFTSTLHEEVTLQSIASLMVPYLADWCVVDFLQEDGNVQRIVGRHSDPSKDWLLAELLKVCPFNYRPHGPSSVPEVLRTGMTEVVNEVDDAALDQAAAGPEHARVLRALGIGSYLVVPLVARHRIIGSISLVSVGPYRYGSSELALAEDLARRGALAIDNARLYRQAREADRRKDEFLAMLSHELRNPLAPIRTSLSVLRLQGSSTPEADQARDMIERQLRNVTRLVDDLLDVSRVTRGRITLKKEPVDVAAVVARAVEVSRPHIEMRRHQLTVELPPEGLKLEADPTRLEQVVTNLLHNAAKYTEPCGQIWLDAFREGGEIVLRVRDTGIGMAPEVLGRAFELFVQAERSLDRAQGGLGIGLTLVKRLVELHGGTVTAHSAGPGKGSEFVVRLPAPPLVEKGRPDRKTMLPASSRRVLIVDDNRDSADSLALLLSLTGHVVEVAYDGATALQRVTAHRPEVVLLDIGLPGMDGYQVARTLRTLPGYRDCLIVAISGYGQEEDRLRAREAGFDLHLVKPVEPEEVQALLAQPREATLSPPSSSHAAPAR